MAQKKTKNEQSPNDHGYKRGDSVESIYSGKAYTVLAVSDNMARVVLSDPKAEPFECTMCFADLKPSRKKPKTLEDN